MVDKLNRDVRFLLLEMAPDGVLATLSNESRLINRTYGYFDEQNTKDIQTLLNRTLIIIGMKDYLGLQSIGGPNSLKYLYLHNNILTSLKGLPEFPKSLERLYLHNNNQLTSLEGLPELPKSLERLYLNNNQLTTLVDLPELPDSLRELHLYNNPIPKEEINILRKKYPKILIYYINI